MKNLAIIENGLVRNIIVIENNENGDKEIQSRGGVVVNNQDVKIGWSFDGKNFIEPEPTPEQVAREQAEAEKQAKKESAKAKLTALGLDEAEVQAILGL